MGKYQNYLSSILLGFNNPMLFLSRSDLGKSVSVKTAELVNLYNFTLDLADADWGRPEAEIL